MITSKRRARSLSIALFLLTLAVLIAFDQDWWPGLLLVIGLPLALKQYLMSRLHDAFVTLLVFGGTYITLTFPIPWQVFLPAVLLLGSFYLILREWVESSKESEEEKEEEAAKEIEEDLK
jgi:hypothetical protein